MKESLEIRLKDEKAPTVWERFVQWLKGNDGQSLRSVRQVPKTGTNTEILLSHAQKLQLKDAVESPGERTSETAFLKRSDAGQDGSHLII